MDNRICGHDGRRNVKNDGRDTDNGFEFELNRSHKRKKRIKRKREQI